MTPVLRSDPVVRSTSDGAHGPETPSPEAVALLDPASDLVAAASAMRRAAAKPGSRRAIPASLGCIGASFDALASAMDAMADELCDPPSENPSVVRAGEELRARQVFDDAIAVLGRAKGAVERAREPAAQLAADDSRD